MMIRRFFFRLLCVLVLLPISVVALLIAEFDYRSTGKSMEEIKQELAEFYAKYWKCFLQGFL